MGRLRSMYKVFFALSLCLCALLLLAMLASQVEQHLFRRRAERLLSQVQSLDLRTTPWQEALTKFQQWDSIREFSEPCDSHQCSFQITMKEFVFGYVSERNLFVKLDDYFRWRLGLSYDEGPFVRVEQSLLKVYLRLGGHPAKVTASIGMRDGVVWDKGIHVWIEVYGHPAGWSGIDRLEFALVASMQSSARLHRSLGGLIDPQLMLHPNYLIGQPSGCTVCVEGWADFTPYAAPEDVRHLMELDLSCLTRWHQCLTQNEIMPSAWAQYLSERSLLERTHGKTACPSSFLELLGRDSADIAHIEILKYRDEVNNQGFHLGAATVRLREQLKGVAGWNIGETRELSFWGGNGRETLELPARSQLVLFRGRAHSDGTWTASVSSCPITLANEFNLSLIRHGIEQDYSALNKTE